MVVDGSLLFTSEGTIQADLDPIHSIEVGVGNVYNLNLYCHPILGYWSIEVGVALLLKEGDLFYPKKY